MFAPVSLVPHAESSPSTVERLASHTSLALGGPIADWHPAASVESIASALRCVQGRPLLVLGGGSNLVCSDAGFEGVVLAVRTKGVHLARQAPPARHASLPSEQPNASLDWQDLSAAASLPDQGDVWLHIAAGEAWDDVVAATCRWGLAGIECLSGIPGKAGATPIQNVGAYGQELSDCLWGVTCMALSTGRLHYFDSASCELGYRHSRFKAEWRDQFVVLEVVLRLRRGGQPTLNYAEIARQFEGASRPDLSAVRKAVLATRKAKSLLFDRDDPNTRNCGSFFVNPIISAEHYARLQEDHGGSVPGFPTGSARVKVPAAWLIERAGFAKGERVGNVGLSTKHTLCLVAHERATSQELVAFARQIRDRVQLRFAVELVPEPVFVGVSW